MGALAFDSGAAIIEDEKDALETLSAASAGTLVDGAIDSETKTLLSTKAAFHTLVITFQVATTTPSGASIQLLRRDMNVDGALNTPVPDSNFEATPAGSFVVPEAMTINTNYTLKYSSSPLDGDAEFFIKNNTGVTINIGWALKSDAKSYNAKA